MHAAGDVKFCEVQVMGVVMNFLGSKLDHFHYFLAQENKSLMQLMSE